MALDEREKLLLSELDEASATGHAYLASLEETARWLDTRATAVANRSTVDLLLDWSALVNDLEATAQAMPPVNDGRVPTVQWQDLDILLGHISVLGRLDTATSEQAPAAAPAALPKSWLPGPSPFSSPSGAPTPTSALSSVPQPQMGFATSVRPLGGSAPASPAPAANLTAARPFLKAKRTVGNGTPPASTPLPSFSLPSGFGSALSPFASPPVHGDKRRAESTDFFPPSSRSAPAAHAGAPSFHFGFGPLRPFLKAKRQSR
jgi:hypothetical protein